MYAGLDLGTSGLKAVLVGEDGAVAAEHEHRLAIATARPGWAEADPADWQNAATAALTALSASGPVTAVGVTGQMHGTVLVDDAGRAVRPAVLWPDRRAAGLEPRWTGLPDALRARLGGPFSPGLTGPVLAWLVEHEADVVGRAARLLLPKDALRVLLAGTPPEAAVTDPSDASGTLLWDIAAARWSPAALAAAGLAAAGLTAAGRGSAGLGAALLPAVVPATADAGEWRGRRLVTGAGDTPATLHALARAVGGWRADDLVVNLGTGAQVIAPVADAPGDDGPLDWHVYADADGGHYAMVAVLSAGLGLAWAQRRLRLSWERFSALASAEVSGAAGVLFAPYVAPERGSCDPQTVGKRAGTPPTAPAPPSSPAPQPRPSRSWCATRSTPWAARPAGSSSSAAAPATAGSSSCWPT
ncbi:MAG: FGGY family carbohydrate kinase [Nocardioides sp.]